MKPRAVSARRSRYAPAPRRPSRGRCCVAAVSSLDALSAPLAAALDHRGAQQCVLHRDGRHRARCPAQNRKGMSTIAIRNPIGTVIGGDAAMPLSLCNLHRWALFGFRRRSFSGRPNESS